MFRILEIILVYQIGKIASNQLPSHIKNVENAVNFYQNAFSNRTLNLVTANQDIKFQTKVQNFNYLNDKFANKSEYQQLWVSYHTALLEIDLVDQMQLQKFPFNLEESYYNLIYFVTNASFRYFEKENGSQVLELPLKPMHFNEKVYNNSKLWIVLPHGPSTRRSLINEMQILKSSVIDDLRNKLQQEVIHVEIPLFHIDSLYQQASNNQLQYLDISLKVASTVSDSNISETREKIQDATKWFEANKPFIFILFTKEDDIIFIGHFCNPGGDHQIPKNKMRDIGYW